jgi:hypothetical protein
MGRNCLLFAEKNSILGHHQQARFGANNLILHCGWLILRVGLCFGGYSLH